VLSAAFTTNCKVFRHLRETERAQQSEAETCGHERDSPPANRANDVARPRTERHPNADTHDRERLLVELNTSSDHRWHESLFENNRNVR